MCGEEFQISVSPKFCTPNIWEHISWASGSNIPPVSLLPFLRQDQRRLILSQRWAQWILASWKPAVSFPSRLCHRVPGWLARKDFSPSQHQLGAHSLGRTRHPLLLCSTFSSVLLGAPRATVESWLGHRPCLSVTPQCEEICTLWLFEKTCSGLPDLVNALSCSILGRSLCFLLRKA